MRLFLQRLWNLARPYRGRLFGGVVLGIISGLMEPVMIAILGGIVGFIVVAMYMPIFGLAAAFDKN